MAKCPNSDSLQGTEYGRRRARSQNDDDEAISTRDVATSCPSDKPSDYSWSLAR